MSDDENINENDDKMVEPKQTKGNLEPLLNMRLPMSCIVTSSSFSGKSFKICSFLYHLAKRGRMHDTSTSIVVFCGSADVNDDYTSFLPKENVRRGWSETTASRILALHKKKIDLLRRQSERAKAPVRLPHLVFVLEDIIGIGDVNTSTSRVLRFLFTSGRHYMVSVIVSSQSATVALNPTLRLNASCILWSKLSQDHLRYVWQATQGMKWNEFMIFSRKLERYQFGMYDSSGNTGFHVLEAQEFPRGKWYLKQKEKNKADKRKTKKNKE